jgi:hypothetical protein
MAKLLSLHFSVCSVWLPICSTTFLPKAGPKKKWWRQNIFLSCRDYPGNDVSLSFRCVGSSLSQLFPHSFPVTKIKWLWRQILYNLNIICSNPTLWSESASELYRPSDRRLSAKWLPTFANRGCHVVSVTEQLQFCLCVCVCAIPKNIRLS